MPVLVVAVAGATCSGKTQICRKFVESGAYHCETVSMDDYYWTASSDNHVRLTALNNYANYEDLASVNWESMAQTALAKIVKLETSLGGDTAKPKVLLVEGILVLNSPLIDRLSHLKVFIRLDNREEFLRRRQYRIYDDDPVPDCYDEAVTWPMYVQNKALIDHKSDVIYLNGTDTLEELYRQFCELVKGAVESNVAFM